MSDEGTIADRPCNAEGKADPALLDVLNAAASLGEFIPGSNGEEDHVAAILGEARVYVKRLMHFDTAAVFLTGEDDFDFIMMGCEPETDSPLIQREIDLQIKAGTFSDALNGRTAVMVPALGSGRTLVLHPLATKSGNIGMFAGVLDAGGSTISDASLNLLTFLLHHLACAVEAATEVKKLNDRSRDLEQAILERTRELNAALERGQAADKVKRQFVANMSHELRTPIHGIMGMVDLLLDSELTAEQRRFLGIVQTSSRALLNVINGILDFSRIESGTIALEESEFDLRAVVKQSLDLVETNAVSCGIRLQSSIDRGIPARVRGDPLRLSQVLGNLVGNAVKFTQSGSITVTVQMERVMNDRRELRFSVADTGVGIPETVVKDLFRPFSVADGSSTRKQGGTGLGLAVSKRLCEMMGGSIGVSSRPGQGSTFWFTANLGEGDRCGEAGTDDGISGSIEFGELAAALQRRIPVEVATGDTAPNALAPAAPPVRCAINRERLDYLREFSRKRDPEMFRRLLKGYLRYAPKSIARIRASVGQSDSNELFDAALALKGTSANLGVIAVTRLTQQLQELGRQKSFHGVEEIIRQLEHEFALVRNEFRTVYLKISETP